MKLSIIIPVFNEEKTIAKILDKVLVLSILNVKKEILIVDDGSKDKTREIIDKKIKGTKIKFLKHSKNQGKGAAVRIGIKNATGDYIVIQDADLEYDPKDIKILVEEVRKGNGKVIYGTRLKRFPNLKEEERTAKFLLHYFGNRVLSLLISVLYFQWITDMETCYKLFPKKAVKKMNLKSRGFEFEPEITSKLLKQGYKILEIPITANPRGYSEGKKLNTIRDGIRAFWTLLKYRVSD